LQNLKDSIIFNHREHSKGAPRRGKLKDFFVLFALFAVEIKGFAKSLLRKERVQSAIVGFPCGGETHAVTFFDFRIARFSNASLGLAGTRVPTLRVAQRASDADF